MENWSVQFFKFTDKNILLSNKFSQLKNNIHILGLLFMVKDWE